MKIRKEALNRNNRGVFWYGAIDSHLHPEEIWLPKQPQGCAKLREETTIAMFFGMEQLICIRKEIWLPKQP